jgi:hypothetical protein
MQNELIEVRNSKLSLIEKLSEAKSETQTASTRQQPATQTREPSSEAMQLIFLKISGIH